MSLRIREDADSPVVASYRSLRDEDLDFEGLLAELESPSARMLEAAAIFLVVMARTSELPMPPTTAHCDALRRMGFIADRLAEHPALSELVKQRLGAFAGTIHDRLDASSFHELGFSRSTSVGRIRRLKNKADAIDLRWRVWGEVELREEFL